MCELTTAMVGLSLAGTAISAAGQMMQGETANTMGRLQQQSYEQQAVATERSSNFEIMRERRKQELATAAARAQVGASGVALAGSPTEAITANIGESELDIAAIQYGSTLKQNQLRTQGAISAFGGQQARTAGYIAGAGTLFSGIGRAVQMGRSPFAQVQGA